MCGGDVFPSMPRRAQRRRARITVRGRCSGVTTSHTRGPRHAHAPLTASSRRKHTPHNTDQTTRCVRCIERWSSRTALLPSPQGARAHGGAARPFPAFPAYHGDCTNLFLRATATPRPASAAIMNGGTCNATNHWLALGACSGGKWRVPCLLLWPASWPAPRTSCSCALN